MTFFVVFFTFFGFFYLFPNRDYSRKVLKRIANYRKDVTAIFFFFENWLLVSSYTNKRIFLMFRKFLPKFTNGYFWNCNSLKYVVLWTHKKKKQCVFYSSDYCWQSPKHFKNIFGTWFRYILTNCCKLLEKKKKNDKI